MQWPRVDQCLQTGVACRRVSPRSLQCAWAQCMCMVPRPATGKVSPAAHWLLSPGRGSQQRLHVLCLRLLPADGGAGSEPSFSMLGCSRSRCKTARWMSHMIVLVVGSV